MKNQAAMDVPVREERYWTAGSTVVLGFALFLFLYNLGAALLSFRWPTDGWDVSGSAVIGPSNLIFARYYLDDPTPIQVGDQLLAINGFPVEQILDAQHAFFRLKAPGWQDGTRLRYDILREGQPLRLDVTIHVIHIGEYLGIYRHVVNSQSVVQIAASLFFLVVGFLVFFLRPGNRAAHALLCIGVSFFFLAVPTNFSPPTWFYPSPPPSIPFDGWTLGINASLMYLALVFPRPKGIVQRFPLLTVLLLYLTWPVAFNTAYLLHLNDRIGYLRAAFSIYPVQIVLLMVIVLASLAHSAITLRDPVGRSQLKWMFAGIFSFVFLGVGGWLVSTYLFPNTVTGGNWLTTVIGWFLLPTCLAIGILRYRLFDIDLIIRRTLVYSILTGLLALVYFGSVTALQRIFSIFNSQQSTLSIVLSTLASAVLFAPLRRRVQEFIDHRFYRKKYDAEKVMADFAATAREETDIEHLSAELLAIVQETVQPESASLWQKGIRINRETNF